MRGGNRFDSGSDYSESEKAPKQDKVQGKYPFLQNHPLYETHQSVSPHLI